VRVIRHGKHARSLRGTAASAAGVGRPPARPVARRVAVAALALLAAALAGPAQAAVPADDVDAAVDRAFAAGDYQRELPLPVVSEGEDGRGHDPLADPDWWRNEGDAQAPDLYRPGEQAPDSEGFDFEIPKALREVLRVLMWIVFVAGGALVVYYLLNEARLFSRWKTGHWQPEGAGGDQAAGGPGKGAGVLEDPERLAARGDYAEAVHVLLLRSIMLIRERGAALSTALTSREILRRAPLGDQERDAFRALVDATELTHFGGRGASEADFLRCRELFHRIARAGAGGAA